MEFVGNGVLMVVISSCCCTCLGKINTEKGEKNKMKNEERELRQRYVIYTSFLITKEAFSFTLGLLFVVAAVVVVVDFLAVVLALEKKSFFSIVDFFVFVVKFSFPPPFFLLSILAAGSGCKLLPKKESTDPLVSDYINIKQL